jgi:UDP-glucose 4-epimerase
VTGGAGFIGSWLVDKILLRDPEKIAVMDNFFLGKMRNLADAKDKAGDKLKIYKDDATGYDALKNLFEKEGEFDVVFNLAIKPLFVSFIDPVGVFWTSIKIAMNLLELQRAGMFRTLIHFSSSEAYGSAEYVPMDEKHPLKPTTPYGAGKVAADHLVLSYFRSYGSDVAIIRPFNTFGPRQNERAYAGVIPTTVRRILRGRPPVIFGDGEQTRDFTYVEDTVEAAIKIYEIKATRGKVINIGQCRETSINELVRLIAKIMGYKSEILYDKPRAGDVRRHCADISLAKKLIGFRPKISLEEGLRKTVAWYLKYLGGRK